MAWAPDYATTSDLRSYLRIDDNEDDPELGLALSAASRAIDHTTNRQFGLVDPAEERTYGARWSRRRSEYVVDIDDLQTATDLVVTVSGAATTGYTLEPFNNAAKSRPWTRLTLPSVSGTVRITGRWGWTSTPATVKQAAVVQASRFFARREAPFGVAGSPDVGSEMRLLDKVDADVAVMLRDYRRNHPFL